MHADIVLITAAILTNPCINLYGFFSCPNHLFRIVLNYNYLYDMGMLGADSWLKSVRTIAGQIERNNQINLERAKPRMLEANKKQLDDGQYHTGSPIKPDYMPSTQKRKGGRVTPDLLDKGDFRDDFFVDINETSILINSTDPKTEKLTEKYTDKIFGVNVKTLRVILNEDVYKKDYEYITRIAQQSL